MNKKLIIIQMNEVNFDLIKQYIAQGFFKNFEYFINNYGIFETESEKKYENLEPWIQWFSFYTGKSFNEHQVAHLNESKTNEWNFFLELQNKFQKKLALLFPMNLKNNYNSETFFLPDPWTDTKINCDLFSKKFYEIIKKIILQNASNKISFYDYLLLFIISLFKTNFLFKLYIILNIKKILKYKFFKAMIFDYLCWEIFKNTKQIKKADVSSIFFNSCAHIQHHYFLNSRFVTSEKKNPIWYIDNIDPVFYCLKLYDFILGDLKKFKNTNFIIATGLSQSEIDKPVFYYNLKDPISFFNLLNIKFLKCIKRMSRDYTLEFIDRDVAEKSALVFSNLKLNNKSFFEITQIENKLFIELTYDAEITSNDFLIYKNERITLKDKLNFIAIKNSIHNQKGYLLTSFDNLKKNINIKDVAFQILKNYE
jgi:hypothetical protein